MPYRAFVSSTFVDLKDHRAHVISSLRRAGFAVDPMEDWTADSDEPKKFSQDRLDGCDLCVLLVAFRRGYVPDGETLSITQLEYQAALKQGIDILPFMLDENAPWPRKFDELEKDPEIVKWRADLRKRHGVEPFNLEPRSIDMTGTLGRWFARRPVSPPVEPPGGPTKIIWDISKDKDGSPYPGLMHFTRKYSRVFFGRDDEIREVLYRIKKPEGRFLIISGGSGTGKSSLVDAGVLPRIEEGGIGDGRTYASARVVPSQGNHPFDALLRPLHDYTERAGLSVFELAQKLADQPHSLCEAMQQVASKGLNGKSLILFLDQMEELFTAPNPHLSSKFLTALYEAAQQGTLRVLATIRSDHLHHCHTHPQMRRVMLDGGSYPLGPIEPYMLSEMIVRPAQCAGLRVSEDLAKRIAHDSGTEPGSLPLLAFVLNQLFEKRSDHELSETVYKNLRGVTGAIAKHADQVEATIRNNLGAKASDLLPRLFQSLVIVKEEGPPTRRRPLLSDFPPEMTKLIGLLVRDRLLQTEGEGEAATVSISHEKLFDAWPALRDHIKLNKKSLMDQTLLDNRARKWIDMGKPWFGGLASGRELKDFQRAGVPTPQAKSYLSASNRAWWMKAATGLALALVFGFIARAWQQGLSVEHTWLKLKSAVPGIHIEPEMVEVKAGAFRMGDVGGNGDQFERAVQRPAHDVKIQKSFKLGKYEVTFDEYDRFVIATGKPLPQDHGWGRGRRPVIYVSWEDARDFAIWLSTQTGKRYRLPTEAEWEYAARSGGKNETWSGTSREAELGDYAWIKAGNRQTQPVGTKKPNGLGIHDMSGNVFEWVEDCWHDSYEGAPTDGSAWLEANGGDCGRRVGRGGFWGSDSPGLRTSYRGGGDPGTRGNVTGFRLAQDIE
jgi:formylglycine-generating enzyme required for sulfatase activity